MALVSQDFYHVKVAFLNLGGLLCLEAYVIGHVNACIICFFIANCQSCLHNTQSKSDWLLNTQSRVLPADWLVLESSAKATLNINMPYLCQVL